MDDELTEPVFDFRHWSHHKARETELELLRVQRLLRQLQSGQFGSEEDFEDALQRYNATCDRLESYTSLVLEGVPRDWLVEGAPDVIDWHDPKSLNWLRQDRFLELQQRMGEARRPEAVSKNSGRR